MAKRKKSINDHLNEIKRRMSDQDRKEKRTEVIKIRVTPHQKKIIKFMADSFGQPVATYLYDLLWLKVDESSRKFARIARSIQRRNHKQEIHDLTNKYNELSKVMRPTANNINQIAKIYNGNESLRRGGQLSELANNVQSIARSLQGLDTLSEHDRESIIRLLNHINRLIHDYDIRAASDTIDMTKSDLKTALRAHDRIMRDMSAIINDYHGVNLKEERDAQ